MAQTFLLVGGTGTVGSSLTEQLAAQGATVRVGTRDPSKHPATHKNAQPVRLDLLDPTTFEAALRGADGVFVLSPPGHADQHALLAPFVDVAARHVKKLVLMTANGVQYDDTAPLRRLELHVEKAAQAHGFAFVVLRPGWFMQNFQTFWLPTILSDGLIALPAGDSLTAFIDARDIAGVAAHALTHEDLDGKHLALTGAEALSYTQAAAALQAASGRPIRYLSVDDAPFHAGMVQAGLPADYANVLVALFGTVRQGFASHVDDTVQKVLGRARTLHDYAKDNAAVWRR